MRPSPLQNRVLPTGEIVADASRGTRMGNRGILHQDKRLGTSRWKHKNWVCCVLSFKGRKRTLMAPNSYTELFFLDEATALAAGHRPCAECQRDRYNAYRAAWETAVGPITSAKEIDNCLHRARVGRNRRQITHVDQATSLPSGVFIQIGGAPFLVHNDHVLPFGRAGYGPQQPRPSGEVTVLTPAPTVATMRAGYAPQTCLAP